MLTRLNPLTLLGVSLLWIAATTLERTVAFQLCAIALFAAMLLAFRRTGPLRLLRLTIPFALFGFGFLTTNVLFRVEDAGTVAVFSEDLARTNAVNAGLVLFLRAVAGGMISLFFALSADPGGLVRALMRYCRLPPRIAFALFAAMQIVPDIGRQAQTIRMADAMRRGRKLRRWPTPAETARLLVPVLAFAIRRAGRTAIAMEARGFAPGSPRTLLDVPGFAARDAVFALALLVAMIAASVLSR